MNLSPWFRPLLLLGAAWVAACNGVDASQAPRIVVSPSSLSFPATPVGSEVVEFVTVSNNGEASLTVNELRIDGGQQFVTLVSTESTFELGVGEDAIVGVRFAPTEPTIVSANMVFLSNDPSQPELVVPISTPLLAPIPNVVRRGPEIGDELLDFGLVAEDTQTTFVRGIENIGFSPLIICDIALNGSADLTSNAAQAIALTTQTPPGFPVILPIQTTGEGRRTLDLEITYSPQSPGSDDANLVVTYDRTGDLNGACATERQTQLVLPIRGEAGSPFLRVNPNPVNFGEAPIDYTSESLVTLTNGGELPLDIYAIRLDRTRTPAEFDLLGVPDLPLVLDPEAFSTLSVTYTPTEERSHVGVMQVEHADGVGGRTTTEVVVAGLGVPYQCPLAIARAFVQEDAENRFGTEIDWAIPLQTLVLDGSNSTNPGGGDIVDYTWEIVSRPEGAVNGLRPLSSDPDNDAIRQYFLPLAGTYEFRLTVADEVGYLDACEGATVRVVVTPQEAIAIELIWTNPDDLDEDDGEGADVDLHFVKLVNPWFSSTWDTYFSNPTPDWAPELPSLDRDDTDGAGPEIIQLDNPDTGNCYAIGVHYFTRTFGTAYPTVRIYVDGVRRAEFVGVLESADDFWDVARIHWPSRTIYFVDEYFEGFNREDGTAPGPTEQMILNGHCATL